MSFFSYRITIPLLVLVLHPFVPRSVLADVTIIGLLENQDSDHPVTPLQDSLLAELSNTPVDIELRRLPLRPSDDTAKMTLGTEALRQQPDLLAVVWVDDHQFHILIRDDSEITSFAHDLPSGESSWATACDTIALTIGTILEPWLRTLPTTPPARSTSATSIDSTPDAPPVGKSDNISEAKASSQTSQAPVMANPSTEEPPPSSETDNNRVKRAFFGEVAYQLNIWSRVTPTLQGAVLGLGWRPTHQVSFQLRAGLLTTRSLDHTLFVLPIRLCVGLVHHPGPWQFFLGSGGIVHLAWVTPHQSSATMPIVYIGGGLLIRAGRRLPGFNHLFFYVEGGVDLFFTAHQYRTSTDRIAFDAAPLRPFLGAGLQF